jgi:hypothetical protein
MRTKIPRQPNDVELFPIKRSELIIVRSMSPSQPTLAPLPCTNWIMKPNETAHSQRARNIIGRSGYGKRFMSMRNVTKVIRDMKKQVSDLNKIKFTTIKCKTYRMSIH